MFTDRKGGIDRVTHIYGGMGPVTRSNLSEKDLYRSTASIFAEKLHKQTPYQIRVVNRAQRCGLSVSLWISINSNRKSTPSTLAPSNRPGRRPGKPSASVKCEQPTAAKISQKPSTTLLAYDTYLGLSMCDCDCDCDSSHAAVIRAWSWGNRVMGSGTTDSRTVAIPWIRGAQGTGVRR
ncbi:hypothetical protein K504DRAFT_496291 [Pleomassaria siparia CBS 279.74]|uniref:Uncharacterized protein n=1 Tax=Pleomassaria siparia CBS 279.74 TaxID=1314801 RepID=A0A6G1KNH6_9PLEO|nr:hypothetical protein K504DRAFT_496291 [Pleomassaria siparia CBS 279.74]